MSSNLNLLKALECDSEELIAESKHAILDEYIQDHTFPWIIGYSGGKDSTLVAHLVFEMLMQLPPSRRTRQVHIIGNDTLVESPLVAKHLTESLTDIDHAAKAFALPITTCITYPDPDQSFWVNLIGRGYPSPNRMFRWCTDRMKIQPTSRYIRSQVSEAGQVILLLGVRRSESAQRRRSVERYDNGGERLNPHNDLKDCFVFRPIVELSTDDVWEFLASESPPWGGSHQKLIKLYRDASGGECPVVTGLSDAPSCGTNSSRFGCWTCTVVDKDRSLEGFVEAGFAEFTPLLDFRDWLIKIRNDPTKRQARRRSGQFTFTKDGGLIPGPFTLAARQEILDKLLDLQEQIGQSLISKQEVESIYAIWSKDLTDNTNKKAFSIKKMKEIV